MIKESLKQLARDGKEYLRYLKYKKDLPRNPLHDDIYIVEFPKSGITWLQHIIGNIELQVINKEEIITFYNHHKYMPDMHQTRSVEINRLLNTTFIKSHSEYNPYYYFIVYLIRNPFDVMVSYYNFLLDRSEYTLTFEEFVKSDNGIIRWKNHVNSWNYKKSTAQKLHFIRYEDLLKNPEIEINNLYSNLGKNIPDDILKSTLEHSSLKNMQGYEDHYRNHNHNYQRSFVGKNNKVKKEVLLTESIYNYIYNTVENEIDIFYPNLRKNNEK